MRSLSRIMVFTIFTAASAAVTCAEVHTPAKGSEERKAIIADLRKIYQEQNPTHREVTFMVPYMRVNGDWAWIGLMPQSKNGKEYHEPRYGLFRRLDGKWALLQWDTYEAGADLKAYYKGLKTKYPGLPMDIFPEVPE